MICLMAWAIVMPVFSQDGDYNPWPWDFPQTVKQKMEVGQTVLSPFTYYPGSVEKKEPLHKAVLIFYDTTIKEVGEEKTILNNYGKDVEMPNSLIIPLPKKGKAKVPAEFNKAYGEMPFTVVTPDNYLDMLA